MSSAALTRQEIISSLTAMLMELESLGAPKWIAQRMQDLGIKGTIRHGYACPLANYMRHKHPEWSMVLVGPQFVSAYPPQFDDPEGTAVSLHAYPLVEMFTWCFDAGTYPELVAR